MLHKKQYLIVTLGCFLVFLLNNCISEPKPVDVRGEAYAGAAKCAGCHTAIHSHYGGTAHNLTSSAASEQTINGSFDSAANTLFYRSALKVVMTKTDSGLYQVAYIDEVAKKAARFDMVMGSGRKGQSYLSWFDSAIFQLPVSYYAPAKSWVNSPGYPPKFVLFNRNIPVGCFDCHSSYIRNTASRPVDGYLVDYFDKHQIVFGIDCERCHGPAAAHVQYHTDNPAARQPQFIARIAALTRRQQLDMCAVCHSGARQARKSSFTYTPGDALTDYLYPDTSALDINDIDVHGKQYQLLMASRCFRQSETLTCLTCHNTHKSERDNIKEFSQRCAGCHHQPNHSSLGANNEVREAITNNCIDCHMPAKPSRIITMNSDDRGDSLAAMVRTHYIAVDKEATTKFLHQKQSRNAE